MMASLRALPISTDPTFTVALAWVWLISSFFSCMQPSLPGRPFAPKRRRAHVRNCEWRKAAEKRYCANTGSASGNKIFLPSAERWRAKYERHPRTSSTHTTTAFGLDCKRDATRTAIFSSPGTPMVRRPTTTRSSTATDENVLLIDVLFKKRERHWRNTLGAESVVDWSGLRPA